MNKFKVLTLCLLFACGDGRLSPQGGTITSVQGGLGLTGGASGGAVTLNVGCGAGITCGADSISLDPGALFSTNNVIPKGNGTGLTASSLTDDGSTVSIGANVGVVLSSGTVNAHSFGAVGTASNAYALDIARGPATTGAAVIGGSTDATWFMLGANEDTYIRPGKATGGVFVGTNGNAQVVIGGVSTPTTMQGNTTVQGNTQLGDAAGDVLDVNGDLSKFGSSEDGRAYIFDNSLGFGYAANTTATGFINYYGYNGGFTQFRDLVIADGKGATACTITGSTKTLNCVGGLQVNGTAVNTFSTNNVIPKGDGTGLTASSLTDTGTDLTSTATLVHLLTTAGNGTSGNFKLGHDTGSATNARNGFSITPFSDGSNYIDSKTFTGGSTVFRVGSGTDTGANKTWLTVTNGTAATTFGANMTVATGDTTLLAQSTTADSNARLKLQNDVQIWQLAVRGAAGGLGGSDQFIVRDETAGVDALVVEKSTGNVGVADGSPTNKLTVAGAASATSGFYTNEARTIGINESGGALQFRTNNLDAQMTLDASANLVLKGNSQLGDTGSDLVGIGVAPSANATVTFPQTTGDKIHLYPVNSTAAFGFGIDSGRLQIFTQDNTTAIGLGYGDSGAFTALMQIDGDAGSTVAITGSLSTTGSATLGDTTADLHTLFGGISMRSALGTSLTSGTGAGFEVWDTTGFAQGVGGAIDFVGQYTSGGTNQYGARIKAMKSNGTDGNDAFDLVFGTRPNGGSLTERMRLLSTGALSLLAGLNVIGNVVVNSGSTVTIGSATTFNSTAPVTMASTLTVNGNATLGDTPASDTHTINGVTTIIAGTPTAGAVEAGTTLVLDQAPSTNNYLTMRGQTSGLMGFRFNNGNGAGDGSMTYNNSSRALSIGTAGTIRQGINSSGSVFFGDTASTGVNDNVDVITLGNTGTGQTSDAKALLNVTSTATYNTTSAALTEYAIKGVSTIGKSAGANQLTSVGVYAKATGGDLNYAFYGDGGTLFNLGAATIGGTLLVSSTSDLGDADNDYVNARGTFAVSGTDVTINACGSSPSIAGEAQSFQVTVGSGTTTCVVNLNRTFNSAPYCTFSAANAAAGQDVGLDTGNSAAPFITSTTTTVTLHFAANSEGTPIYNVWCPDRR